MSCSKLSAADPGMNSRSKNCASHLCHFRASNRLSTSSPERIAACPLLRTRDHQLCAEAVFIIPEVFTQEIGVIPLVSPLTP